MARGPRGATIVGIVAIKAARSRKRARTRLRTLVEIGPDRLYLALPDGRARELPLSGAELTVGDATFAQRFVRHLHVEAAAGVTDLITPPEEGAIAPRAAQLPRAPDDAGILERGAFDTLVQWLGAGGRLGGCTIAELAALARVATASFAVVVGELAGQLAVETVWLHGGPMRGGDTGDDVRRRLRPLEEAARTSERAAEALTAALAFSSPEGRRGPLPGRRP